jgi:5'-nucleotidase
MLRDKTIVNGDVLIDDKPRIEGSQNPPSWKHVLFHQPYNANENKPRIVHWNEWKSVLEHVFQAQSRQ